MLWLYHSISLLILIQRNQAFRNEPDHSFQLSESNPQQIRSPLLEVFMHLPSNFRDVTSFKNTPGLRQQKRDPRLKRNANQRTLVDVRSYELAQPVVVRDNKNRSHVARNKRNAEPSGIVKTESEKFVSSSTASQPMLPSPEAIRGPIYKTHPVKEFDIVDIDEPDDTRRRTDSPDRPDDNSQRDKRTFLEDGSGETTTPLPFWKRKKENPPFVTGRGSSVQSGSNYPPAQHRSAESERAAHTGKEQNGTRESHSLKNLDKTLQSNEISRSNQDNYYSATNRRTYSRQFDSPPSSTPKSVYDTIDYSQKRNQEIGFGRNQEPGRPELDRHQSDKKETFRETRPTHEQYTNRQAPYNFPWVYDKPYYQPAYPYPTEVLGRGVEYYHRTYDPTTGRIIYYANMPDQGRSYDYRYMDPINRNFYVNRPYYDPYYRSYVPPLDYRFASGFGRSMDYMRNGRSSSQAYSYPLQEREKFPRDARLNGAFETGNRGKDEFKNKTYIIYDADESRSQFPRPQIPPENRPGYTPPPNIIPSGPQVPFRQFSFPPVDYFPPSVFPFRNQYYPSPPGPAWGFSHRSTPGVTDSNSSYRPPNSREVQLPLTTSSRDLDKPKKS